MATSSFTKNFKVKEKDSSKFVEVLSTKKSPKTLDKFESKYTHPQNIKDLLKKSLGN